MKTIENYPKELVENSFTTLINFCDMMPECGVCPYFKGCNSRFPGETLARILSSIQENENVGYL